MSKFERKQTNDNLPTVNLINANSIPSQFKSYPDGVVIKYKPYTFGDGIRIQQSKMSELDILDEVNKKIIVEGLPDATYLTWADFLYIGFLIKISSLETTKFTLSYKCDCGHLNEVTLKGNKLPFKDLQAPSYPIIADMENEGEFHFRPILTKDVFDLKMGRLKYKGAKIDENNKLAVIALHIKNKSFDDAYEFLLNLSPRSINAKIVKKVNKLMDHGLEPISITCTNCNQVTEYTIEGGEEQLLKPFCESEVDVSDRVRFGNK